MTDSSDHESPEQSDQELPVCLKCLTPHLPLQHYCRNCGETVGRFSSYIPFISIPFSCSIFAIMWKGIWFERDVPFGRKVSYVFMIFLFAPIMVVGLPFVVLRKLRRKTTVDGTDKP